jgi:hypothetical protein
MSSVTEIRDAIRKLPAKEAWRLAEELRDHLDALWDDPIDGFLWIWIGPHDQYERLLSR